MKTENNKIIAEFMGVKETFQGAFEMYGVIDILEDGENEQHFYFPSELKFHSDWNWLMEVVEKIENLKVNEFTFNMDINLEKVQIKYKYKGEWYDNLFCNYYGSKSKKETIYDAVIEFIEWYKQQ